MCNAIAALGSFQLKGIACELQSLIGDVTVFLQL